MHGIDQINKVVWDNSISKIWV